jgi:anti-sigma B factor antagonist
MAMESAAPAQELKLETESKPNGVLIRCSGRITSSTSPYMRDTIRPIIAGNKLVVMDLTDVSFMDSSGLGSIVGLWVNAKKNHCEFKLVKLNERIKDLLRITQLASLEGDQDYFGM